MAGCLAEAAGSGERPRTDQNEGGFLTHTSILRISTENFPDQSGSRGKRTQVNRRNGTFLMGACGKPTVAKYTDDHLPDLADIPGEPCEKHGIDRP